MKKRMRSILAVFLTVMLGAAAYAPSVCAAEAPAEEKTADEAQAAEMPMVEVPVTVTLSGTEPDFPETFHIRLQAENAENPMPEGSQEGSCLLELAGANTGAFPSISYPKVGIYHYTISQDAGSNSSCSYDKAVYYLTVYVTNAKDGGLESTTVLYKDKESDKLDRAVFHNAYASVQNPGGGSNESGDPPVIQTIAPKAETQPETIADPAAQTDASSNGGQTGDEAMPVIWGILLFAAACMVVVIMVKRKKYENTEE